MRPQRLSPIEAAKKRAANDPVHGVTQWLVDQFFAKEVVPVGRHLQRCMPVDGAVFTKIRAERFHDVQVNHRSVVKAFEELKAAKRAGTKPEWLDLWVHRTFERQAPTQRRKARPAKNERVHSPKRNRASGNAPEEGFKNTKPMPSKGRQRRRRPRA